MITLTGKVATLTGAGRINGVGAATARLLAKHGCNILINSLTSKEQAAQIIAECKTSGVEAEYFAGDITQTDVCKNIAEFVLNKWGRADILINCAGATKPAAYERLDLLTAEDFAKILAVNVTAPFLMAQAFQALLKQSKDAVIINVSSAAGISGKASSIAYAAAKGAENTLTLALAQALSPEIRVNAVCPSFIESSWWENSYQDNPDKFRTLVENMRSNNLLNQVLKPENVAETILSVIHNKFMSGELIRLDSGSHVGKANPR